MPLPSSGTITLGNLQTEFGGSNPVGISEYYRGGGLVPDVAVNANVPTSGQISLSNFYGASNSDPNPTAFAFTDIALNAFGGSVDGATNTITISGINVPITLDFRTANGSLQASGSGFAVAQSTVSIYVNDIAISAAPVNNMSFFAPPNRTNQTQFQKITVYNNDAIYVEYQLTAGGDDGDGAGTSNIPLWTVSNDSSGNTVLDTFSISGSTTT